MLKILLKTSGLSAFYLHILEIFSAVQRKGITNHPKQAEEAHEVGETKEMHVTWKKGHSCSHQVQEKHLAGL